MSEQYPADQFATSNQNFNDMSYDEMIQAFGTTPNSNPGYQTSSTANPQLPQQYLVRGQQTQQGGLMTARSNNSWYPSFNAPYQSNAAGQFPGYGYMPSQQRALSGLTYGNTSRNTPTTPNFPHNQPQYHSPLEVQQAFSSLMAFPNTPGPQIPAWQTNQMPLLTSSFTPTNFDANTEVTDGMPHQSTARAQASSSFQPNHASSLHPNADAAATFDWNMGAMDGAAYPNNIGFQVPEPQSNHAPPVNLNRNANYTFDLNAEAVDDAAYPNTTEPQASTPQSDQVSPQDPNVDTSYTFDLNAPAVDDTAYSSSIGPLGAASQPNQTYPSPFTLREPGHFHGHSYTHQSKQNCETCYEAWLNADNFQAFPGDLPPQFTGSFQASQGQIPPNFTAPPQTAPTTQSEPDDPDPSHDLQPDLPNQIYNALTNTPVTLLARTQTPFDIRLPNPNSEPSPSLTAIHHLRRLCNTHRTGRVWLLRNAPALLAAIESYLSVRGASGDGNDNGNGNNDSSNDNPNNHTAASDVATSSLTQSPQDLNNVLHRRATDIREAESSFLVAVFELLRPGHGDAERDLLDALESWRMEVIAAITTDEEESEEETERSQVEADSVEAGLDRVGTEAPQAELVMVSQEKQNASRGKRDAVAAVLSGESESESEREERRNEELVARRKKKQRVPNKDRTGKARRESMDQ
ncbi:hypothetical protein K490DRAFT_69419 [Saccharata proteae CBS 121410]|uniref:Uncharacterized protein n=1 Tax=Saccharata proteae CBS 121410 TaxID=1314787 RepID=A0A9P4LWA3_9PEZI|nr:hypothetical protein K490DRAFT_69419 [Saccharata proteae CBS 121410]